MAPSERILGGCIVGHTINGRRVAGSVPSRPRSLATAPTSAAMTEHCICRSPVSPDDGTCQHSGKPLDPEQAAADEQAAAEEEPAATEEQAAARKKPVRPPRKRGPSLRAAMLRNAAITACAGIIVQDLVGSATVSGALLSQCVSLWSGFFAVLRFQWKFPIMLYPYFAKRLGADTAFMMILIAVVLSESASLTDWPVVYGEETAAYIETLPVVARLTSGMEPRWVPVAVLSTYAILFAIVHMGAAVLGSTIAFSMFCKRPRD